VDVTAVPGETCRFRQPLTKPGPWWGGFFLLPEFQPIYDFETNDFSAWIGVELGKMLAPGRIAYIKPGWGIDNSETTDRKSTIEVVGSGGSSDGAARGMGF